jgi:hypothetical protein
MPFGTLKPERGGVGKRTNALRSAECTVVCQPREPKAIILSRTPFIGAPKEGVMQSNRGWLMILTLLLLLVVALGLFLYRTATSLAESISGLFVFYIFLMLALLIPLEILVSDLIGRGVWYTLSELGNVLLTTFEWFERRIYDELCYVGRIASLAVFVAGFIAALYGAFETGLQVSEALAPCEPVFARLIETPYNRKLLSKCPFTEPLAKIVSDDVNKVYTNSNNLLPVLIKYMDLFTETFYLGVAIIFASGIPRRLWRRLLISLFATVSRSEEDVWKKRQEHTGLF